MIRHISSILTLFLLSRCLLADAGPNWIEQWGIRWTFDKNITPDGSGDTYQYGTYVNGDYWIIGPLNVISITPPCTTVDSPQWDGSTLYDRIISGSMLNPRVIEAHGYDNSVPSFDTSLCVNMGISAAAPLAITVDNEPIRSLVSTVSLDTVTEGPGREKIRTAAVLTVVASPPGTDAFRPPFAGTAKPAEINASSIDLAKTPLAVLPLTPSAIAFSEAERRVERVWLTHNTTWWHSFMHPTENMPRYGRDIAKCINEAALMLNADVPDDKTVLMHRIIQVGIDLYGIVLEKPDHWDNDGGGMNGRVLPFTMAAYLLDHAGMHEICTRIGRYIYKTDDDTGSPYWPAQRPPDYVHFGELDQTHYVSQVEVDICTGTYSGITWHPDSRYTPHVPYTDKDIGLPEYAIRHATDPGTGNNDWAASAYRGVNSHFPGAALVAHIMGIKDLFNHPAYFDYSDRVMHMIREGGNFKSWRSGTNSPGAFVVEMWETYRADYGCIYTGLDTLTHERQYEGCTQGIPSVPGRNGTEDMRRGIGVCPNPARNNVLISVTAGTGEPVCTIYDRTGRIITTLHTRDDRPVCWNTTDQTGRPVESGTYLLRYGPRFVKILIER